MMDARINIYNSSGLLLRSPLITKDAEKVESLMVSDYIELSWHDISGGNLPAGAYIVHEGEKFTLRDTYIPEQKSVCEWVYTPQFVSRVSLWSKVPFFFYTRNTDGAIISKEPDWSLTDMAGAFMQCIAAAIKEETGEDWSCVAASDLTGYRTISFEATDIFSALSAIASEWETEWLADKDTNTLYLGKAMRTFSTSPELAVGKNIGVPQVTLNKDGAYNRFYVFGSTRNIAQEYAGANVNNLINKRLTLDPEIYPGGYIDRRKTEREPVMSKVLTFDDIYPKSNLIVTECRPRLLYVLDNNGDKVQIGTDNSGNPVYDLYAIWYIQLGSQGEDGIVKPFRLANTDTYGSDNPEGVLISGKPLSIHFKSGALSEREFELTYHSSSSTLSTADGVPFQVKEGDFEIIFNSDSDYIIPAVTGIVPADGDKAILFNLRMPDEYLAGAYLELKEAALEMIESVYEDDNNNYEVESNPILFDSTPALLSLKIGQKVIYRNGDYTYETRIISKTSKLDYPCEQTLTLGNARIKGNTETLKEQVSNSSKDINILMSFNELAQNTINSYNRTLMAMQEGFSRINRMWQFDKDGNIYSEFNVYSLGAVSAFGFQEGAEAGSGGVGIDETQLAQYLSNYATREWVLGKNYLDRGTADTLYQPKGNYLTEHQSLANYLTKTEASNTYQPKGNYLTQHQSLDHLLTIRDFNELFEKVTVEGKTVIKAKYSLYSVDEMSAFGFQEGSTSGGGVGINKSELAQWLIDNNYATQSWVEGKHYLTSHQDISGKVDKVVGKGLSANDFTDTLLAKLNGLTNYTHPTGGADTTIAAATGKVLSSITVNSLGHVTAIGSKTLAEGDIPTLAVSKISGLQTTLNGKLDKSLFDELFEKVTVEGKTVIKAKYSLYSVDELSAFGFQEGTASGGGVGINASELAQYLNQNGYATQTWVQARGYLTTHQDLSSYAKKTDIPNLSGYATQTWVEGKKYLTQHQSLANYVTLDGVQTIKASKYFAASMRMQGCDIILGTSGSESDDSGDLVWQYGPGQEKMRIYSDNSMTSAVGPYYRCYKKDGTLLYSGRLATLAEVDTKLDASVFNELFAKETQNGKTVIKAKFSLYSVDEMSAFGFQEGSGGTGGVGINASELASYLSINGYATQSWVGNNYHPAGRLINMGSDGVSEAGRYLDFHTITNGVRGSEDYTARIDAGSAATARVLTLPSTSGTLATQEWVSGKNYLTSHQSLANYAKLQSPNNLLYASNEFTFIPDVFTGESVWLNYRFGTDGNTGKLKEYHFGNGTKGGRASLVAAGFKISGGTSSQALMADGSVRSVNIPTTTSHLGWAETKGQLTTIDSIAFWNGRYNANTSNLQYCDRGRFGTMAVATATDYLKLTGGTLTGTLIQNGASFINNTSEHRLVMGGGSSYCWIDNRAKDETVRNNLILYGDRITTKGYIYATYFKASATTLCENLNADLLDGVHNGDVTAKYISSAAASITNTTNDTPANWSNKPFVNWYSTTGQLTNQPSQYGFLININRNSEIRQIWLTQNGGNVYHRAANSNGWGHQWRTFIDSANIGSYNAGSATKLATARSIWGQNFNGTGNVSGNMTGVGSISPSADNTYNLGSASIGFKYGYMRWIGAPTDAAFQLGANNSYHMYIGTNGNVGIGTTSPSFKLDVSGETCVRNSQFRLGDCARQLIIRNDGTNTYLMYSDAANGGFNSLRPLYINNTSGDVTIGNGALGIAHGGVVQVGSNLTVNNTLNVGATNSNGAIEIYHATPYIDFHFGRSAADYTTRIIEYASGSLRVEGNLYTTGELTALTTSDLRLKRNVRPVDDPLRMLRALGGYRVFDYLPQAGVKDSREHIGLIYQAVCGVTGERMRKLRPDGYGALNYTCPDYINLIGASVLQVDDEIKRLKKRIEKLEKLKEAV